MNYLKLLIVFTGLLISLQSTAQGEDRIALQQVPVLISNGQLGTATFLEGPGKTLCLYVKSQEGTTLFYFLQDSPGKIIDPPKPDPILNMVGLPNAIVIDPLKVDPLVRDVIYTKENLAALRQLNGFIGMISPQSLQLEDKEAAELLKPFLTAAEKKQLPVWIVLTKEGKLQADFPLTKDAVSFSKPLSQLQGNHNGRVDN